MIEKTISIKSNRNTNIKCTIIDSEFDNSKLVLFFHGFKADRTEGGRFLAVAKNLASLGANSIMMSFAGCTDSDEDFINYTLANDLDDIELCYQYMLDNYSIDKEHIGVIGYSMGARLASIFINKHSEVNCLALWAGFCIEGFGSDKFLGGNVIDMYNEANIKGYCNFYNAFDNTTIKINKELLDDITKYNPYDGLNKYDGNAIVVHGDKDITVDLNIGKLTYQQLNNAKNKKLVIIKDANHGFGLWDNHNEQSQELVDKTSQFFKENL